MVDFTMNLPPNSNEVCTIGIARVMHQLFRMPFRNSPHQNPSQTHFNKVPGRQANISKTRSYSVQIDGNTLTTILLGMTLHNRHIKSIHTILKHKNILPSRLRLCWFLEIYLRDMILLLKRECIYYFC